MLVMDSTALSCGPTLMAMLIKPPSAFSAHGLFMALSNNLFLLALSTNRIQPAKGCQAKKTVTHIGSNPVSILSVVPVLSGLRAASNRALSLTTAKASLRSYRETARQWPPHCVWPPPRGDGCMTKAELVDHVAKLCSSRRTRPNGHHAFLTGYYGGAARGRQSGIAWLWSFRLRHPPSA